MSKETLIEFPADIVVKAMGLNTDTFQNLIIELVVPHIDNQSYKVSTLPSKGDKYISVSVHFTATSLDQLHRVYAALRQEPLVLYTL